MTPAEARCAVDRIAPKDAMAGWLSAVTDFGRSGGRGQDGDRPSGRHHADRRRRRALNPSKLAAAIKVVALLLASEPYGAAEADAPILAETVGLRIAVEVEGFRKALAADQRTARTARLKGGRR